MSTLETLISMGFDEEICKQALTATRCAGVEQAINWIVEHPEGTGTPAPAGQTLGGGGGAAATAGSTEEPTEAVTDKNVGLKCEDCGKVFLTSAKCEVHAVRTGHQNFSQVEEVDGKPIQPMTEEEKKAKLKELEERIKARRAAKEKEDELEAFEKERQRIQAGKSMADVKKKLEEDEMKKMVEERKRQKAAERDAKLRVLRQIEEDKERRRMQAKGGEGVKEAEEKRKKANEEAAAKAAAAPKRSYDECRLQFRFPGGAPPVVQAFPSSSPLSTVVAWLSPRYPPPPSTSLHLATNFPKKVFAGEELDKSLQDLGLVPASALNVQYK